MKKEHPTADLDFIKGGRIPAAYLENKIKLYAYQPNGHVELSFFTIAESEIEARKIVDKHIKDNNFKNGLGQFNTGGLCTDYYTLTVCNVGEVIENSND